MSQHKLTASEVQFLQETLVADQKKCNIRLKEGEYQYSLAKSIASFQLEMRFPDVKDIIRRLYGEEETNQIQFVRKIQTILKKMEKSNIVKILPKTKPWDLQRYMLASFRFEDVDKNVVVLATDQQLKQTQETLSSVSVQQNKTVAGVSRQKMRITVLIVIVCLSYAASAWVLLQHIINPLVFVVTFSIAVLCSLLLGRSLSWK